MNNTEWDPDMDADLDEDGEPDPDWYDVPEELEEGWEDAMAEARRQLGMPADG